MDFNDRTIFTGPVKKEHLGDLKGRKVRVFARNTITHDKPYVIAFTMHITLLDPEIEFWYPDFPAELQFWARVKDSATRRWLKGDIRRMVADSTLKVGQAVFAAWVSEDMLVVDEPGIMKINGPWEAGERENFFLIYFKDWGKILVWHYRK